MAGQIPELPKLNLGTAMHEDKKEISIAAQHRARGTLINGQSGLGKSSLMTRMIVQDMEAGLPMLIIDPHDLGQNVLQHVPKERIEDVVVLSLRADEVPLWSIHPGGGAGDMSEVAALLTDAWKAQYGEQSVGVRAEGILYHSLLSLPPEVLSPLELMAVMVSKNYRTVALDTRDMHGLDFPLQLFWREVVDAIRDHWHEWNQSTFNKIAPMLLEPWPRRAFCGTPPAEGTTIGFEDLDWENVSEVTWLRDRMYARNNYDEEPNIVKITDELDPWLIDERIGNSVWVAANPDQGFEIGHRQLTIDRDDMSLRMPTADEAKIYGRSMGEMVKRRRRRRGWRRFSEFFLEVKGIKVKETLDIADLLDDNRIIIVEIPQIYGFNVTRTVATFALLGAIMRGNRQLQMPESHQIPMSLYIDEASLFLSPQMERTLAELRKAKVCLTLAVQRLGQFGGVGSGLRRGIVDTVGTVITLNPGIEETPEMGKLLHVGREQVNLARGQGVISTLKADWSRAGSESFDFEVLAKPQPEDDPSLAIRAASYNRYYQEPEQADAIFKGRAKKIQATFAKGQPKDKLAGPVVKSPLDSMLRD